MKTEERERDFREMRAFSQVLVKHRTRYFLFEAFSMHFKGEKRLQLSPFSYAQILTRASNRGDNNMREEYE